MKKKKGSPYHISKKQLLPKNYQKTISEIVDLIGQTQQKTLKIVNRFRIDLYWEIGAIVEAN